MGAALVGQTGGPEPNDMLGGVGGPLVIPALNGLDGRCWGVFIASWEVKVRTSPCLGKMCQVCGVGREGSL